MNYLDWELNPEAQPQGTSNGFWYDITGGGYLKPEDVLISQLQIDQVRAAISTLLSFECALDDAGLLNEF